MINKTIYMTYKKNVPDKVFNRWRELNPVYEIDLSLDEECITFLRENFNNYVADLFISIPQGIYKADLWRLCKLYMNGGVYADVDLVPYLNIDTLDKNISFYSCLSINLKCIFQAFMINFTKPKNSLIFIFLLSFLLNNPQTYCNGPPFDMFKCIKYNLNNIHLKPDTKYFLKEVKIPLSIGSSESNIKKINLYYFPEDIEYIIRLHDNFYKNKFEFKICKNQLIVERIDENNGWEYNYSIDICIKSSQSIYLFKENIGNNNNWVTSYVTLNSKKILDSRDLEYFHNKGW